MNFRERYYVLVALVLVISLSACQSETDSASAVGLANPASVYCHYLGANSRPTDNVQNGSETLCELPTEESCEEWALYRGECSLQAEISEPFAFCSEIGNSLVLPPSGIEPRRLVPQSLLAPMRKQGLVSSEMPASIQGAVRWRCMDAEVYVCPIGANLPCSEQADLSRMPAQALQDFCSENPDADGLPAFVTGRATVYAWSCKDGIAVAGEQLTHADNQGYLAKFWHLLQPE